MKFYCAHCSNSFSSKAKLKQHVLKKVCFRKVHQCWCGKSSTTRTALLIHNRRYHSDHRPKLESCTFSFGSLSEFESWKATLEKETITKFVKPWASYVKKNGSRMTRFVCHRSGNARIITDGRKRKRSMSCKINNACSASIFLEEVPDGSVRGKYCAKHCNHERDTKFISLSQKKKARIADDLNKGTTFKDILEESQIELSKKARCNGKQTCLLARKDMHNVVQDCKISSEKELSTDTKIICRMVEECEKQFAENSPVKFFAAPNDGNKSRLEGVDPKDFVLIIMTSKQKQILLETKHEQICLDSSFGLQGYEFYLTTIFSIDDSRVSLPVAFCISNSVNENIMSVFFFTIMRECGHLNTPVFISEDTPVYINAWCKVIGIPGKWQVDKSLRQNIQKLNGPVELNTERDEKIRNLLEEMSSQVFNILLKNFVSELWENENTKEFGRYFDREYNPWLSNCLFNYKSHILLHANARIETMYRVLKDFHFKGVKMKRLDFSVFRLLKLYWDNLFLRLKYRAKENNIYSLKILGDRHNAALSISKDFIVKNESCFEIRCTEDGIKSHTVEKQNIDCTCRIKCYECNLCFHAYTCTCIDYSVMLNVCKHVHAVCMYEKNADLQEIFDINGRKFDLTTFSSSIKNLEEGTPNTCFSTTIYNRHPNQDLIDSLYYTIHSLQTFGYENEDFAKGAIHIKKACDIFCKTGFEKFDRDEKLNKCTKKLYPHKRRNVASFETDDGEFIEQQVQIETVDQPLVDEVEEIVYIDNVDVHYTYDHP